MIFLVIGIFIIFLFIVLILFSFPQFSPIPYFPTNRKDLPLVIKGLQLKNNQVIYDLGAGDGEVIFEAAKRARIKKLNTEFVAVDINPALCFIMWVRKWFHPNKNRIHIVFGDLFKVSYPKYRGNYITIFLYVSPWFIEKILTHVRKNLKISSVVTYYYSIPSLRKKQKMVKGVNTVFTYRLT